MSDIAGWNFITEPSVMPIKHYRGYDCPHCKVEGFFGDLRKITSLIISENGGLECPECEAEWPRVVRARLDAIWNKREDAIRRDVNFPGPPVIATQPIGDENMGDKHHKLPIRAPMVDADDNETSHIYICPYCTHDATKILPHMPSGGHYCPECCSKWSREVMDKLEAEHEQDAPAPVGVLCPLCGDHLYHPSSDRKSFACRCGYRYVWKKLGPISFEPATEKLTACSYLGYFHCASTDPLQYVEKSEKLTACGECKFCYPEMSPPICGYSFDPVAGEYAANQHTNVACASANANGHCPHGKAKEPQPGDRHPTDPNKVRVEFAQDTKPEVPDDVRPGHLTTLMCPACEGATPNPSVSHCQCGAKWTLRKPDAKPTDHPKGE